MLITALCIAATLLSLSRPSNSPLQAGPLPSVLGGEPDLRQLAQIGHDRSPTFRKLITELHARRGFLILGWSSALPRPLNGALMDRVRVTPDGVVCLWVGLRPARPDEKLLPLLAHELQHAVEALKSRTPDRSSLEPFFRRIAAFRHVRGYETAAALEVQSRVRRELR